MVHAVAGELVDPGLGAFVDRPADRVLHLSAAPAVLAVGVEAGQVLDHLMGVTSPVNSDQQVFAIRSGELGQGFVEHVDVVDPGARAGVAGSVHDRQRVADVGAPGGQRVMPDAALEMAGDTGFHRRRLDDRRVHPDHRDRPGPPVDEMGQRLSRDPDRRQLTIIACRHDLLPGMRSDGGEDPAHPPSR